MPRLPGIFTDDEYHLVQEIFSMDTASKYHLGRVIPHPHRRARIVKLFGRDPWSGEPAPVAAPEPICQPTINKCQIDTSPRLTVNPCADDDVCLAVRKAAMRPVANRLLDQKREIPCTNCREGIARAKAEAAMKVRNNRYSRVCPECGKPKNPGSLSCPKCIAKERRASS